MLLVEGHTDQDGIGDPETVTQICSIGFLMKMNKKVNEGRLGELDYTHGLNKQIKEKENLNLDLTSCKKLTQN